MYPTGAVAQPCTRETPPLRAWNDRLATHGVRAINRQGQRVDRIRLKGTTASHGDALPLVHEAGDTVMVVRGRPRTLVFKCPDGCGDTVTLNLDGRAGKAWTLYQRRSGLSLYPSVWRDNGCESHFIIWNNRVLWLDSDWWTDEEEVSGLADRVIELIPSHIFIHFRELADQIDEIPWSVLRACRHLARAGRVIEGEGDSWGRFRRILSKR